MATGVDIMAALHEDWLACVSGVSGMEALNDWEWLPCLQPQRQKNVSFTHPLVTSCHYRPRESREECSRLYFSSEEIREMKAEIREMKAENRARRLEKEKERVLKQKILKSSVTRPMFETIGLSRGNVKVMYAVPQRSRRQQQSV